jgi:thiol-disulfide isomerase/thioredoxin
VSLVNDRRENQPAQDEPSSALRPGTPAPDFTLQSTPDQSVSLSDFRGQPVILAFYPADWSPVCGDQMALYNEVLPEFRRFNAELIGLSVDGVEDSPGNGVLGRGMHYLRPSRKGYKHSFFTLYFALPTTLSRSSIFMNQYL